jgi:large subunit ribosomal protein L19
MDTKLIERVTKEYKKVKHPEFKAGDIIEVHSKIREEKKERTQIFKGIVLAISSSGISKTFTIRKISYGIGVEKIFPFYSPNITKIKVIKQGKKIRRSKLYYLRGRVGKLALKAGIQVPAHGENLETQFEKEVVEKTEKKKEEESKKEVKEEKVEEKSKKKETKKVKKEVKDKKSDEAKQSK